MAARRNNTMSASAAEKAGKERVRKAKPRKTAAQQEARKARRAELKDAFIKYIRAEAQRLGVVGRSGMTRPALINAILRVEFDGAKKIARLPKTKEQKAQEKAERQAKQSKLARRQGRGPFRLLLFKDEGDGLVFAGNLGPYVAARGAQVDAKTMLRRMAGDEAVLDHAGTVEDLEDSGSELSRRVAKVAQGGLAADGWVAWSEKGDDGEELAAAIIVKYPKGDKAALRGGRADEDIDALRNPRRRGAGRGGQGGQGGRSNPRVSFQTRQGPVSFNTRSNGGRSVGARGNKSRSGEIDLGPVDRETVDGYYEDGRPYVSQLVRYDPEAMYHWQTILIYMVGNGKSPRSYLHGLERAVEYMDVSGLSSEGLFGAKGKAAGRTVRFGAAPSNKVTAADFDLAYRAIVRAVKAMRA
jgi:hypothetical protein